MDSIKKRELEEMILLSLDKKISEEQLHRLNAIISSDSEALRYCMDIYSIAAYLRINNQVFLDTTSQSPRDCGELTTLMRELGEYEKSATTVETTPLKYLPQESEKNVICPITKKSNSKLTLALFILSAAALVFIITYAYLVPPKESVAEVVGLIQPRWSSGSKKLDKGDLLFNTDGFIALESGILKIQINYGPTVILEGPCRFACKSTDLLRLDQGRVFTQVPSYATGFTVQTPVSRIVDLGTEFGVEVASDGTSSTQVFKGKARMISKLPRGEINSVDIEKGQAKIINGLTMEIKDASFQKTAYVRSLDAATSFVWRGEKISLAEIVGGANGIVPAIDMSGISLATGKMQKVQTAKNVSTTEFLPVDNPFIEGVFLPNGLAGPVQVSSQGHLFDSCPSTNGFGFDCIKYYMRPEIEPSIGAQLEKGSVSEQPAIWMHANAGITFSLKTFHDAIEGATVHRFRTKVCFKSGVENAYEIKRNRGQSVHPPQVDIFILIDGHPRFERREYKPQDGEISIDIPIQDEDMYLSLLVTDSGYGEFDEIYFLEPLLILSSLD